MQDSSANFSKSPGKKSTFARLGHHQHALACDYASYEEIEPETVNLMWEDAVIDKEAKRFLKLKENGRYLPLDMVSHLDFFYNTLLVSHETSNPFRRTRYFEAL